MKQSIQPIFIMITASLVLAVVFQIWPEYFFYLRQNMLIEPWRFFTAHFVHVGWIHYALNMLALVFFPYIFPKFNKKWFLISILSFPIFISTIFYYFYPQVGAYAGFSGVLHGLYALGAIHSLTLPNDRKFGLLILIGLMLKLLWEEFVGERSVTMRLIGSPVLIEAHQYGVVAAILLVIGSYLFKKLTQ